VPDNPEAWLVTVAARRLINIWRSDDARRRREELTGLLETRDAPSVVDRDDTLLLLFLCCHPALTPSSAIALTLRAVGGLTTAEIASAFLVPEATMAQRISRAKQRIHTSGAVPAARAGRVGARLSSVLHVLYLIFSEGYASTGRDAGAHRPVQEAIRLTARCTGCARTRPRWPGCWR
jgi:predicted RNA polymerase sigma factor